MIDISSMSGLPLGLDDSMRLVFGEGLNPVTPDVRTIEQARGVLWNMTASGPQDLYFMYRDVHRPEDKVRFDQRQIRYDITVIVPGDMGGEYVKTVGHYHPYVPGTRVGYPEVYEVIHGKAHYLLQRVDETGKNAIDVIIVEAGPGDKVLIPPGYGHVTINPGTEPLVMCNLIEYQFKSIYGTMSTAHGAAYYEVIEDDGTPVWVDNEHYSDVAEPRLVEPYNAEALGLIAGTPLYSAFVQHAERFDYLVRPHLHQDAMRRTEAQDLHTLV